MSQSNRSPRDFVGLVPPFPLTLWAAESSYTQASPVVGTAVPSTRTAGRLVTMGDQTSGASMDVQVRSPAFAGRDAATVVWRGTGDTRWRGQDAPVSISGWESVAWCSGATGFLSGSNPHVVTLADGQVLAAYGYFATFPSTTYGVRVQRRTATGSAWGSSVTAHSQTTALTRGFYPCLLVMPSGRVLLFYGQELDGRFQVAVKYSEDNGDTWAVHSQYTLTATIALATYVPGRIRVAYDGRQMLMMIQARGTDTGLGVNDSHDYIWQWASTDLAGSFTPIQAAPSDAINEAGAVPDVVALRGGGFVLLWAGWFNTPSYSLKAARLPNAFTDYRDVTLITPSPAILIGTTNAPTGSSYEMAAGDLTATLDEVGNIWVYVSLGGPTPTWDGTVYLSADDGQTFEDLGDTPFGSTSATWSRTGDTATFPRYYAATWWRGCAMLVHQWAANPGTNDNSIGCIRLGGWSTVTMPQFVQPLTTRARPVWTQTLLPFDLPDNVGWTATGAGTAALTTSAVINIATAANTKYYTLTWTTGDLADGICVLTWVDPVSGGSLTSDDIALNLRLDDGAASESFEVSIRFTTTGYRVYDIIAGATVTSSVTVDTTAGIHILAGINDGKIFVAYWVGTGSDREYTISHDGAALTDGGGTTATRRIQFGHIASATAESNWRMLHYSTGDHTGEGWADGQTSPDAQWSGPLSPTRGYLDDGVSVRGEIGPFVVGDTFTIAARNDQPVGHLLWRDKPSTRRVWASSSTAAQNVAWRIEDGYSTAGLQEAAIVLILGGCNWRTGVLARYRAGTWQSVATIDLATGLTSLPYTRTGNTIHVNTAGSSTGPWYMHRNALIGATVDLGGGKLRKVIANSDGMWTTGSAADMRRPRLKLAGVDNTEGASGTCNIWMPGGAIVIHLAGTNAESAGYRLTIDSQTIVDSTFTTKAHLGPLVTFVVQPDSQRTITYQGNVEDIRYRDGTKRRIQRGPTERSVTIGWQDQIVPEHHVKGDSPAPSYAMGTSAANAYALAALGAEPYTMAGLLEDLDGMALPVGYVGYVPRSSSSPGVTHLLRPDLFLVGHATPEIRIEEGPISNKDAGGGPFAGNLTRIAELTIEDLP